MLLGWRPNFSNHELSGHAWSGPHSQICLYLKPLNLHLSLGSPFSCFGARWYPLCSPPPFLQCSRVASLFPHPSQFSTQEHSELRLKPSNYDLMASPMHQRAAPLKKTLQTQSFPQETPRPFFHTHTTPRCDEKPSDTGRGSRWTASSTVLTLPSTDVTKEKISL